MNMEEHTTQEDAPPPPKKTSIPECRGRDRGDGGGGAVIVWSAVTEYTVRMCKGMYRGRRVPAGQVRVYNATCRTQ